MNIDLIPKTDVVKPDLRNSKKRILESDNICINCGCIINGYWEDSCIICECKGRDFVVGKISRDIRLLLEMNIDELKIICDLEGISPNNSRSRLTINLMRKIHPILKNRKYQLIDEILIRKIILRNHRKFRYMQEIEDFVKRKKDNKHDNKNYYQPNIKLISDKDVLIIISK